MVVVCGGYGDVVGGVSTLVEIMVLVVVSVVV